MDVVVESVWHVVLHTVVVDDRALEDVGIGRIEWLFFWNMGLDVCAMICRIDRLMSRNVGNWRTLAQRRRLDTKKYVTWHGWSDWSWNDGS